MLSSSAPHHAVAIAIRADLGQRWIRSCICMQAPHCAGQPWAMSLCRTHAAGRMVRHCCLLAAACFAPGLHTTCQASVDRIIIPECMCCTTCTVALTPPELCGSAYLRFLSDTARLSSSRRFPRRAVGCSSWACANFCLLLLLSCTVQKKQSLTAIGSELSHTFCIWVWCS